MKFYPRGTGLDRQTEKFTKVKQYLILKIKSEFVNGSDISESICKEVILDLSKEMPIKRISTEDKPSRVGSQNDFFKAVWNIQIQNNVNGENKLEENVKKAYAMIFKQFCPSHMTN